MKFTVEYARSVRVKQYETLRYSMLMEADSKDHDPDDLRVQVRGWVETWIAEDLEKLQARR